MVDDRNWREAARQGVCKTSVAYLPCKPTSHDMFADTFQAMADIIRLSFHTSKLPPATVAEVDLDRLLGIWFEVARLPNLEADGFGQRGVDVTATYEKWPDGTICVQTVSYNAKARMRRTEVNGTVQPANPGRSQLLLTFYRVIRGRLWIIGLDHDYRWALMGTPSRRRLWLISCSPRLPQAEYDRAMAIAAAQGYDAAGVRPTLNPVPPERSPTGHARVLAQGRHK